MLLKAWLRQILFSIRSERQLVEAVNYNLLYRWFFGLNIEDKVWDHSTFSANLERLFNDDLARAFFECVKLSAQWGRLASDEYLRVNGTLIGAWASHMRFKRKDDDSGTTPVRDPEVDFKGQERCNHTHASTTDTDARLFKKRQGDKSRLFHMGYILMENCNGLFVDVEITYANGSAEREAALSMLERRSNGNKRATVGADNDYEAKAFIKCC